MTRRSLLPFVIVAGALALLAMHGISAHGHPVLPASAHHAAPPTAEHGASTASGHGADGGHDRNGAGDPRAHGVAELCTWIVLGAIAIGLRRSGSRPILAERLPRHRRVTWTRDPPVPKLLLVSSPT